MCLTPRAGCSRVGAARQVPRHILPKGIPGRVCVTWGRSRTPTKYLMDWHCLEVSLGRAEACPHHYQCHPSRHHLTTLLGPPPCLHTENHPLGKAMSRHSLEAVLTSPCPQPQQRAPPPNPFQISSSSCTRPTLAPASALSSANHPGSAHRLFCHSSI